MTSSAVTTRIAPTFRPDRYLEPAAPGWADAVKRLGAVADTDTGHYAGYLAALEERRRYFVAHGAVSADHLACTGEAGIAALARSDPRLAEEAVEDLLARIRSAASGVPASLCFFKNRSTSLIQGISC